MPDQTENASERDSQPGGSGIRRSPRKDPVGTVRTGSDDRYAVKVDASDHGWYSPDGRRYHHSEVSGLRVVRLDENASERPNAGQGGDVFAESSEWLNRETRRQCDAVVLALGPLYNDDRHSWSVENLAKKAAEDITSGTKRETSLDSGTLGAMARVLLLAVDESARADAAEAKLKIRDDHHRMELAKAGELLKAVERERDEAAELLGFEKEARLDARRRGTRYRRERDEARAKLADIRGVISGFQKLPSELSWLEVIQRVEDVLDREPLTDREEPAEWKPAQGDRVVGKLVGDPDDQIEGSFIRHSSDWVSRIDTGGDIPSQVLRATLQPASEEPAGETKPRTLLGWTVPPHIDVEHDEARGVATLHCPNRGCLDAKMSLGTRGPDSDSQVYSFLTTHEHGHVVEHQPEEAPRG